MNQRMLPARQIACGLRCSEEFSPGSTAIDFRSAALRHGRMTQADYLANFPPARIETAWLSRSPGDLCSVLPLFRCLRKQRHDQPHLTNCRAFTKEVEV